MKGFQYVRSAKGEQNVDLGLKICRVRETVPVLPCAKHNSPACLDSNPKARVLACNCVVNRDDAMNKTTNTQHPRWVHWENTKATSNTNRVVVKVLVPFWVPQVLGAVL